VKPSGVGVVRKEGAASRWSVDVWVGGRGVQFGGFGKDVFGYAGDVEVDFKAAKGAVAQGG
jgi:hypothetical protein